MSMSALQASAYLHHIHLGSPAPEALARFYAAAMDMEQRAIGGGAFLATGPARRLIVSDGPAKKLIHAGFAVRDADALAGLRVHAEATGAAPKPFTTPLFKDGAFSVTDPDGNIIAFGLSQAEEPVRGRIRGPTQHLTLATRDVAAIEGFYVGKLGFAVSDRVVRAEDNRVTTCFMRGNHEHHNLACFYHQDRAGIDHHSYEAGEWDTIRDWADHLAEHGIQLMWGPGRHGPGNNLFIFIVDPDDNWIEISAELEVMHDRPVKIWPHAPETLNLWGKAIMRS